MSELPIKATLKAGGGYDAPWLTVDANNPDDLAFKLKGLVEHPNALTLVVEAANALKAINNVGTAAAPQAAAPAAPPSEPAKQQGWGQTPAAAQQNAAPQHRGGQRFQDPPHPEGKGCEHCPNVLVKKKSTGGKEKWQCPDWRWNNGNPTNHTVEWID